MRHVTKTITGLAMLVSLSAPGAALAQAEAAPVLQHSGSVEFITGGVGETELKQMRAQASAYNLKVVTTAPSGAYVGSADLTIADAQGRTILTTRTRGPLFYARLPEGRYVVSARDGDRVQQKTVRVGSGAAPEVALTLATAAKGVASRAAPASASARARVEDQGVSLYDLDPGAAERAKAQVRRYEVYPDGTTRAVAPNEVPGGRSVDAVSEAVKTHIAPVEPGAAVPAKADNEQGPAPGAPPSD